MSWRLFKTASELTARKRSVSGGEAQELLRKACAAGTIRAQIRDNPRRVTINPDEWNGYDKITPDGWFKSYGTGPTTRGVYWPFPIELFEDDHDHWLAQGAPQSEPAPPTELEPTAPQVSEPSRKGAPPEHDWDDAENYAKQTLDAKGDPTDAANWVDGWKHKIALDRAVLNYMIEHGTEPEPDIKTIGKYTRKWLTEWREEKERKERN
jgi:hypothetical protein